MQFIFSVGFQEKLFDFNTLFMFYFIDLSLILDIFYG